MMSTSSLKSKIYRAGGQNGNLKRKSFVNVMNGLSRPRMKDPVNDQNDKKEDGSSIDNIMSVNLSDTPVKGEEKEIDIPRFIIREDDRLGWDLSLSVVIIFYAVVTPMRLAFSGSVSHPASAVDFIETPYSPLGFWFCFDSVMDVAFIIDIVLNFRTTYTDHGKVVSDFKLIAQKYLKLWFWLDFLASIPFSTILLLIGTSTSAGNLNKIMKLCRLFKVVKLLRILKIGRIINRVSIRFSINAGVWKLVHLVTIILSSFHFIACAYWAVSRIEGFCDWVDDALVNSSDYYVTGIHTESPSGWDNCVGDWVPWEYTSELSFQDQYTQAFFWAVMVITGIGWDVAPGSDAEVGFTAFVILLGVFLDAIVIGSIKGALDALSLQSIPKAIKMDMVNLFLSSQKTIPSRLRMEVNDFYDYTFLQGIQADVIAEELPTLLQIKLAIALKDRKIRECELFEHSSNEIVVSLIHYLQREISCPAEYLIHEGEKKPKFYILEEGHVTLSVFDMSCTEKWEHMVERYSWLRRTGKPKVSTWMQSILKSPYNHTVVQILDTPGDYFGEASFLDSNHQCFARSTTYSEFYIFNTTPEYFDPKVQEVIDNPVMTLIQSHAKLYVSIRNRTEERTKRWKKFQDLQKLSRMRSKKMAPTAWNILRRTTSMSPSQSGSSYYRLPSPNPETGADGPSLAAQVAAAVEEQVGPLKQQIAELQAKDRISRDILSSNDDTHIGPLAL